MNQGRRLFCSGKSLEALVCKFCKGLERRALYARWRLSGAARFALQAKIQRICSAEAE